MGLADSEKAVGEKRERLFPEIQSHAVAFAIGRASVNEIDELNILNASLLAMKRAVEALTVRPDHVLADGNKLPTWDYSAEAVVGGDGTVPAISAASILAKVTRDQELIALDAQYPEYGFAKHKGYPTSQHMAAIKAHGILPIHRRSFGPHCPFAERLIRVLIEAMEPTFVHLRVHSEFSLTDGLVRVGPLMKSVAAAGMPAVAVTDRNNFFGLIKAYKAAEREGVKLIIGADFEVLEEDERRHQVTFLAQSTEGYRNPTVLISQAYQEGQILGRPLLRRDWIQAKSQGLIALSGGRNGEVGQHLVAGRPQEAVTALQWWMSLFPDRYYLELQRTGRENEEDYLHSAVELAFAENCPVVATNEVCFLSPDEYDAHEARVCIGDGRTLNDPRRPRHFSEQQYLRTPEEMAALFEDIPEAIENTFHIAARCSTEIELGKAYLPDFPTPEGVSIEQHLENLSKEGLDKRLAVLNVDDVQAYRDRLKFELDIINQMGFPGYFLVVMDFIRWGKANGIPVGPGRGSGAGSLVAYALEITDLDPIEYDLLFERFLNPQRVSMPDFDVDFCMDRRDEVIEYVAETYGRNAVSQIITFGTMAAKAVVRDVARVQDKPYALADKMSKLIPFEVGMTLEKALEQEEQLVNLLNEDGAAQEIWDMAVQLEGLTRNAGKHAGGVVIAPSQLTDFSPLFCDEEGHGLVTQYDKNDVEDAGLVKFDFFGLRTLTIIDWAVAMINERDEIQEPVDINDIPLDDDAVYSLLQSAETTAVFQLESRGMKELIKSLRPDCFEDIIALVALFRPGPLQSGMVENFIDRKHGESRSPTRMLNISTSGSNPSSSQPTASSCIRNR